MNNFQYFLFFFFIFYLKNFAFAYPQNIPIGAIYNKDSALNISETFSFAIQDANQGNPVFEIEPQHTIFEANARSDDTWKFATFACQLLKKGALAFMANGNGRISSLYSSISHKTKVPFINWNYPAVLPGSNPLNLFEISMFPPIYKLIGDWIEKKRWTNITYIYDEPEALINLQMLNNHLSMKNHKLCAELKRLEDLTRSFEFFFNFHSSRNKGEHKVVLDISTSDKQQYVLKRLADAALKTRNFHYLIAGHDINEDTIDTFKLGMVSVSGFRLANTSNLAHIRLQERFKTAAISTEQTIVYDSVQVLRKAFDLLLSGNDRLLDKYFRQGQIYVENQKGIECDGMGLNASHAEAITSVLKKVVHDGVSGHIQFGPDGLRKNFTVDTMELYFSGASNVMSISSSFGKWNDIQSFRAGDVHEENKRKILMKKNDTVYRVTMALSAPFVMYRPHVMAHNSNETINCTGNACFEGYCIDLLAKLAERIETVYRTPFKYDLHLVRDGKFGSVGEDGEWNGMIGELLKDEADLAVTSLTITKAREAVVDFSKPFMTLGISIMIKKPDKQEFSVFSFMSPLSTEIWMYIIFAYLGVSTVVFLVSRFSPYEWRIEETPSGGFTISNDFSIYNCLWFTLASFLQQGTDILPRSVSGRIASSAWWFFTMIIVSSYTANLAAFLTLEKMHTPIESVEDLAKQTKIKYGIQKGGSTAEFFRESKVQIYQRMWQYMSSQVPSVFVGNYQEGINRVRESKGRYAFLLESTTNEYTNTRKPCDTMKVGQNLNSIGYGVATPFGSELKDKINLAILDLQEVGELKKLENKWWYDRGQCEKGRGDTSSSALNLSKVAGIFYILIGGMMFSMLTSLSEFLYRSRIEARKGQRSLSSSMKAQLSLSVHGEKDRQNLEKMLRYPPLMKSGWDGLDMPETSLNTAV